MTADDIYNALHYGNGLKDAKVGIIEIEDVPLTGKKIPNISIYHSIEFHKEFMLMWRYYGIGEGLKQPYCKMQIKPSAKVLKAFSKTDKKNNGKQKEGKKREDRQWCSLFFCHEEGCKSSFETIVEREAHEMKGLHYIPLLLTSTDKVKHMFVEKMKGNLEAHSQQLSSRATEVSSLQESDLHKKFFGQKGWALPKRSDFRYNARQKILLYKYFIEGERSGKKKSPDEVHSSSKRFISKQLCYIAANLFSLLSLEQVVQRRHIGATCS